MHGDFDLVLKRMQLRQGHYMKTMLRSQFETLEVPAWMKLMLSVDIDAPFEDVVERCVNVIKPLRAKATLSFGHLPTVFILGAKVGSI